MRRCNGRVESLPARSRTYDYRPPRPPAIGLNAVASQLGTIGLRPPDCRGRANSSRRQALEYESLEEGEFLTAAPPRVETVLRPRAPLGRRSAQPRLLSCN